MNHVEFDGWEYIGVKSNGRKPNFGCCCYKHNPESRGVPYMKTSAYYRKIKVQCFVVKETCMLEHLLMEN